MSFELAINTDQVAKLDEIVTIVKFKASDACLGAVGKVVAKKAKQLAPSSRATGSRDKWSKKYKEDPGWSEIDSGKQIGYVVRKYPNGANLWVGGEFPLGNKLQFNNPEERVAHYWNNEKVKTYRPPFRIFHRAFDESIDEQRAAFLAAFEKVVAANG